MIFMNAIPDRQEHTMSRNAFPLARRLRSNQFLPLHSHEALCLRAERGTLWLTIDGEIEDIVLEPGERRVIERNVRVLVGALGSAAALSVVPLRQPVPRGGWLRRLALALHPRWRPATLAPLRSALA
jgi:hypothetical protein